MPVSATTRQRSRRPATSRWNASFDGGVQNCYRITVRARNGEGTVERGMGAGLLGTGGCADCSGAEAKVGQWRHKVKHAKKVLRRADSKSESRVAKRRLARAKDRLLMGASHARGLPGLAASGELGALTPPAWRRGRIAATFACRRVLLGRQKWCTAPTPDIREEPPCKASEMAEAREARSRQDWPYWPAARARRWRRRR